MPTLFEAQSQPPKKRFVRRDIADKHRDETFSTPLTSYVMHPTDIKFETQETGEEVVLFMRQHIITLIPSLLLQALLVFVPFIGFPYLLSLIQVTVAVPVGYIIVVTAFWYVAVFGYMLTTFIHWYFNIFIVTNRRVIDIDFLYLLYKKFAEARIDKIQDISFRTGGIMATVFDYGDVMIQTAGELPNFLFDKVPYPSEVVHVISELSQKRKGKPVV